MPSPMLRSGIEALGRAKKGDLPSAPGPSGYAPEHFAIVHLRSEKPWNLRTIHAHFKYPTGLTETGRVQHATDILAEKLTKGVWSFTDTSYQPELDELGQTAEYEYFRRFRFGSQHDIFVFFEHSQGDLRLREPFVIITDDLLGAGSREDNYSFYDTKDISMDSNNEVAIRGSIFLIRNHFKKKVGGNHTPINNNSDKFIYKLNLVYTAAGGIEMIIDPDTGNGMGSQP